MAWLAASLRQLRDGRTASLGFGILVLVTAFVAAAAPLFLDRLADQAVREEIRSASPALANLQLAQIGRVDPGTGDPIAPVAQHGADLETQLPASVEGLVAERSFVVETPRWSVLAPLVGDPTTVALRIQDGIERRIAYVEGRAPTGTLGTAVDPASGGATSDKVPLLEAAVSTDTAARLGFVVGTRVSLTVDASDLLVVGSGAGQRRIDVDIVGTFRPLDPGAAYWYAENGLLRPSIRSFSADNQIVDGRVLLDRSVYGSLLSVVDPVHLPLRYLWRAFIDPDRLAARSLPSVIAGLHRAQQLFPQAAAAVRTPNATGLTTSLARLLDDDRSRWNAALAVVWIAITGPLATALAALALVASLGAAPRRRTLALWRARGASGRQAIVAMIGQGLVIAAPATALATVAALWLLPGSPPEASLLAGGGVGLLAVLLAVLDARATGADGTGDGRSAAGRSALVGGGSRRIALEIGVTVLAATAIYLLRERGLGLQAAASSLSTTALGGALPGAASGAAGAVTPGPDPLLAAAPALGGVAAALAARRLIPLPLGVLARLAARRADLEPVLALRRARRLGGPAGVLGVLLVGAAVVVFTSVTLLSLDAGADEVAWGDVGASYRITSIFGPLPANLDPTRLPGVTAVAGAYRGIAKVGDDPATYRLLAVDAPDLAVVAAGTPADPRFPEAMTQPLPSGGPIRLPVIVSRALVTRSGLSGPGATFDLLVESTRVPAQVVAVRDAFPAEVPGDTFVVAARGQLLSLEPGIGLLVSDEFLRAPVSAAPGIAAALAAYGSAVELHDRAAETALLRARPITRAVVLAVLAATAVAVLYAALALLAGLALAGAARADEVAHLRMLGLSRRGVTAVIVLEYVPILGLAIAAGAILGLALFLALGDALGLSLLLGSLRPLPVTVSPEGVVVAVVGTATVVAIAIALASVLAGRAALASSIRRGLE